MKKRKKKTPKMPQTSKESNAIVLQIEGNVILRQIQELEKEHRMKI